MNNPEKLLDQLINLAEQAQVIRMFKNSALDGPDKLKVIEKEIAVLKTTILLKIKQ